MQFSRSMQIIAKYMNLALRKIYYFLLIDTSESAISFLAIYYYDIFPGVCIVHIRFRENLVINCSSNCNPAK